MVCQASCLLPPVAKGQHLIGECRSTKLVRSAVGRDRRTDGEDVAQESPTFRFMIMCLFVSAAAAPAFADMVTLGNSSQPRVVSDGGKRVSIIFGRAGQIVVADSTDGGSSFQAARVVASAEGMALGMRRGPRAALTENTLVVAAIAGETGNHESGDVWCWTSTDDGRTFSRSGTPLNSVPDAAREGLHALAASPDGRVVCVWLDMRNVVKGKPGTEVWMNQSNDGGVTWEGDRVVYRHEGGSVCECCHPSVAIDAAKNIHVMFRHARDGARDMYLTSSRDGGRTFSAPAKLGTGTWLINACPMDCGDLSVAPGGEVQTVWKRDGRVFSAVAGKGEHDISKGNQPVTVATSRGPWMSWTQGRTLMSQLSSGMPVRLAADATYPHAAMAADETIIVASEQNKEIVVQRVPVTDGR